jgi:LacI family transcriptional regulator
MIQLQSDNPDLRFTYFEEGNMLFTDNMMLPAKVEHPYAAETMINFVYEPEIAARIALYVNYIPPVEGIEHLVERGHRRIGMIDCPGEDGLERRHCFLAAAQDLGLPIDTSWVLAGEESMVGGAAAFTELHATHPDLSAVFAYNDVTAVGAFRAARRLGLAVPEDCALLGFDGLSIGELLDPPLTTLNIDKRRMGQLAVDQVDGLLLGTTAEPALLRPELVIRGST